VGCDACDDKLKRILGCGYEDRFKGRGIGEPAGALAGDDLMAADRTCPEWYARTPFVVSLWMYLAPYRAGALGPAWELDNLLFELLQVVDAEAKHVESEMTRQLYED